MQAFNQNGEGGQGGDQGCVQGGFQVGAQGDGQGGGRGDGQGDGQEGGSHSSCAILQLQPEQMQGFNQKCLFMGYFLMTTKKLRFRHIILQHDR